MELRVNGETRQNSPSSKMSVKISEILSHYSPMGYSAGDVVSTGAGMLRGDAKARYLKVGDVMECEIENIGILRNRIISWEEAYGRKAPAIPLLRRNVLVGRQLTRARAPAPHEALARSLRWSDIPRGDRAADRLRAPRLPRLQR